ncbi:MAG: OmpA family protein [Chitinophagaceae bacterium]
MCRTTGLIILLLSICCAEQVTAQRNKKNLPFKAPFIYSLAGSFDSSETVLPASIGTDTLTLKPRTITRVDSIIILKTDTAASKKINGKLDSIQSQLFQIKKIVWLQSFEARYNQLLFQRDSVLKRRMAVQAQKTFTNEDRLRVQVYTLQADSISNELLLLRQRMNGAGISLDSVLINLPATNFSNEAFVDTTYMSSGAGEPASSDTLTAAQLRIFDQQLTTAHSDEKYEQDSIYRATIDSLDQKLKEYKQLSAKQVVTTPLPSTLNTDSLAQDSLQKKMVLLKNSLQANSDSLLVLQRSVRQLGDSDVIYRQQAAASRKSATADSIARTKWYRRILPGGSGSKAQEVENDKSDATAARLDYNDKQLASLNGEIDRLKIRNSSIRDDYQNTSNRRSYTERSNSRPSVSVVPVIIPGAGNNRDPELNRLRSEITTLNAQLLLNRAGAVNKSSDTLLIRDTIKIKEDTQITALKNEVQKLKMQFQEYEKTKVARIDTVKIMPISPVVTAAPKLAVKAPAQVTIYFASGSSAVAGLQTEKLEKFMRDFEGSENKFSITGYTDATGSALVNNALAAKRMKRIEELLVNRFAIPVNQLVLNEPVTDNAGPRKQRALDRKVIIAHLP